MASIKLSITVDTALRAKYDARALARIDRAVAAWIRADAARGLTTVHLAVDDAAAMAAHGVAPVGRRAAPEQVKRALDALCRKLQPDYVVLFGGDEIVPMFRVANPSHDPAGDDDRDVPTDNPYACSTPYRADDRTSFLVPDRALGRIPDLTGDADPAWLLDYLARVGAWTPRPPAFYARAYAVVCDEWKAAGAACMSYLGLPDAELQISPPAFDDDRLARARLPRSLHLIKCHGASLDPRFYGQRKSTYPEVLKSATLEGRLSEGTLAAAMCCYGAQVYSPADPAAQLPGARPLATTYLRHGAVGFAGSTRIAWVGIDEMMCADWIAAAYLKSALAGASLGRALLEAKQDYVQWLARQGRHPDTADEKTLIEYVLLGDPSLHPVAATPAPAATRTRGIAPAASPLLAQERRLRRVQRAAAAVQLRGALPERHAAAPAEAARAGRVFESVAHLLGAREARWLEPARAQVQRVVARAPAAPRSRGVTAAAAAPAAVRESLEYTWTGRGPRSATSGIAELRLLKVETDAEGRIVRTRLLHGA